MPALEVAGLSHAYGKRRVLHEVSLRVMPGEFTVLLGPNGAGKSTLFALITRLFDARQGAIRIFGAELRRQPGLALSQLGVVFQQPTLDPDLSLRQNLAYSAALHGIGRAEARARARVELARVGLEERADDVVRSLSGGQRRRVEIARALLPRPRLLLLDEPTVGLDAASRAFVLGHVRTLCQEDGLAVLWATHLIDEVDAASRVVVLHDGRVRACGTVPEILAAGGAGTLREAFARLTDENGEMAP
ncbi:ATP-binding cassette domain-containing protein [Roseomonas marmotae]|uniref:ATP-binding cassette domain-containing protein n=1 Tax=Roseomonas marmotae TaxID=2768161 RepID=A0ABS3KGT2_9PROT|nr:ATP-binding cassette domain-containing protein [Roseomonas marmotae]MBO1075546.1 ATP-binding cassette domain-containing protein [Roseomonas marmotae]QTI81739.1 ATP-binding cassette domain-containing protein [Roseomonas marmotae]